MLLSHNNRELKIETLLTIFDHSSFCQSIATLNQSVRKQNRFFVTKYYAALHVISVIMTQRHNNRKLESETLSGQSAK